MKRLLIRWIMQAVAAVAASYVTRLFGLGFKVDVSTAQNVAALFLGVAIWAILNATLGRVLKLLTIPLNCLTLGLFSLVINALMLWLASQANLGFHFEGEPTQQFLAALVASILMGIFSSFLNTMLADEDSDKS